MNGKARGAGVVIFCLVLCSCATVTGLKTDVTSTYEKISGKDAEKSAVFYVAVESLELYPEPQFSKNAVTVLQRDEKVLRYKLSKGFAYVRVVRTGETGWLKNSSLDWKRAGTEAPPAAQQPDESMPQDMESDSPAEAESTKTEESREGSVLDSAGPGEAQAPPVPPVKKTDTKEKKKPKASIFDSF